MDIYNSLMKNLIIKLGFLRITLLAFAFITLLFTGCKKDPVVDPVNPPSTVDELKVDPNFDWKTTKEITLSVIGLKEVNPAISNTLYVKSSKGDVYYKDLLKMNSDYTIKFTVPSTETSVTIVYGSIFKPIALASGTIMFNYITE
jgi:hypothetical protein